jgi:hypothetical protein
MKSENWSKVQRLPADDGVQDAQDIAAALLLRRVESMLRNGQPRQAVAHIVAMTGAEPAEAGAFVEKLKSNIFG